MSYISNLPAELLEIVVGFLDCKSIANLIHVDERVKDVLMTTDRWLVTFPKRIDWASPTAPKQYVEYDRTDFTLHYRGREYTRTSGIVFGAEYDKKLNTIGFAGINEPDVKLSLSNLVIQSDSSVKQSLVLGRTQYDMDRQIIIDSLRKWPVKPQKPKKPQPPGLRRHDPVDETIYREFDSIFPNVRDYDDEDDY